MADSSTNPPSTAASSKSLTPAAESSDPAVHQLLAEIETVRMNAGTRQRDKDVAAQRDKDEQKVIDEKTAELRKLGYSVG